MFLVFTIDEMLFGGTLSTTTKETPKNLTLFKNFTSCD